MYKGKEDGQGVWQGKTQRRSGPGKVEWRREGLPA